MNFLDTHELLISTLSPVHIGCGEDYEPTNYVIDNGLLYAFDPAQLLTRLDQKQREELSRALDERQPIPAIQRFFYRYRAQARDISTHRVPVAKGVEQHYLARVGQIANREQGGGYVVNKLEIARTAFNPVNNLPILPGSSLKGAIRTALLEAQRAQAGVRYPLSDQEAGRSSTAWEKARKMEKEIFHGSFQTDPMRLVKVADAAFRPGSYKVRNTQGEEIQRERQARTLLFQANRKKRPNQFAARGNIETIVECIPASQPYAFAGKIVIERKANCGAGTPQQQFDFAAIAKACNDFYLTRLEAELSLLEERKYASETWIKNTRARLAPTGQWGKAIAEGRGFLLRIGRHCGAESVTVDAPRKIKIMKGKNQPAEWASEATTLWLAATEPNASGDMLPFGWVFVQRQ